MKSKYVFARVSCSHVFLEAPQHVWRSLIFETIALGVDLHLPDQGS